MPDLSAVSFTVHGLAAPAGSKKAFTNRKTGRAIIVDDSKRSRPWKTDVAATAAEAMNGAQLLTGPLELHVRFYMPRPQGHFGTGRNAGTVKTSAPHRPVVKPDATKLLRGLEDACTGVIWRDDAQIVTQHVEKHYGEPARAIVAVAQLKEPATNTP